MQTVNTAQSLNTTSVPTLSGSAGANTHSTDIVPLALDEIIFLNFLFLRRKVFY